MKSWIKRAVGAAALAGGLVALGGAAQAHAAESASRPARAASIEVGACGVVSLGGSQADACASKADAADVKVHVGHAPRAGVQRTRRLATRQARSVAGRLRATVPPVSAKAELGQHAAQVDAGAKAHRLAASVAGRADASVNGKGAEHSTATSADVDAYASFGAGNTGPTVGGVDGRISAKVNETGAATARADLDANLGTGGTGTASASGNGQLITSTNNDGATSDATISANLDMSTATGGAGTGVGGVRTVLRRGALRPGEVVGSGGVLDGLVTEAPATVVPSGLGELLPPGNPLASGADLGQAVARGLRAVAATADRPILGSRSPLSLGSPAVPRALAPTSPGSVAAARLAAARSWAGITVGARVAAGGQAPSAPIRALSAKPATMLAMTGGHAVPLLWLGLAMLLTGVVALARARSVAI